MSPGRSTLQPWRVAHGVVVVRFRLTPRGGRDAIDGLTDTVDGPAFKSRVRAVPEGGAANGALLALVAGWLDVPAADVALVSGQKSRVKCVSVTGDVALISAALGDRARAFELSAN